MSVNQPDRWTLETPRVSFVKLGRTLQTPANGGLKNAVAALLRRGERCVLVDMEQLEEIDASGIGELMSAFNATRAAGGNLIITRANARVRRLLGMTGVLNVLGAGVEAVSSSRSMPASNARCWGRLSVAALCG